MKVASSKADSKSFPTPLWIYTGSKEATLAGKRENVETSFPPSPCSGKEAPLSGDPALTVEGKATVCGRKRKEEARRQK